MDMQKLSHGLCEVTKHWHLPVLIGLIDFNKLTSRTNINIGGPGDEMGDNILPKEILISLSSRKDSRGANF